MNADGLPERLDRTVLYESDYVCLYADKVRLSSGHIIEKYHQIHYPKEAVSIVIFNGKDEILMIREKRYTVGRLEWEIPAGKVEKETTPDFSLKSPEIQLERDRKWNWDFTARRFPGRTLRKSLQKRVLTAFRKFSITS